jgi:hypothetical protein
MTRAKAVLLALVAVLLLSGCEVKAQLLLKDDGSGTFTYVVGIDKDFLAKMDPGADPLGSMRKNAESQPYKVTLADFETDKEKGLRASFDFTGIDDLKQKLAANKKATDSTQGSASAFAFDVLGLTRTKDGWKLSATAGVSTEARKQLPFDATQLRKLLDAEFSATLPGHAGANNATTVSHSKDGTTFSWNLLAGEGNLDLQAQTTSKKGGFPVGAAAVPVLLLLVGGGYLAVRRYKTTVRRSPPT